MQHWWAIGHTPEKQLENMHQVFREAFCVFGFKFNMPIYPTLRELADGIGVALTQLVGTSC